MLEGAHLFTDGRKVQRASYTEVVQWVKTVWEAMKTTTIKNTFIKCKIIETESCQTTYDQEASEMDDDGDNDSLSNETLNFF